MGLHAAAKVAVTAPDGGEFVVLVRRVLWPGHSRSSGAARDIVKDGLTEGMAGGALDLFTSRFVWRVRVYGARRFGIRPLIYGEEWRDRNDCVERARQIADDLAAGRRP